MISIAEAGNRSNSPIRDFKINSASKLTDSKVRRKRRYAKTYRYSDEEILNSRLKNTRVRLNVGGEVHEVMWRTLKRMPFTRLGLLRKALSHDQIMELCDDYDLEKNEYYFDRHPKSFLCVLTMFRTGNLHMIEDLCIINFSEDLDYWGINENLMESCCHHRYHMKRERINEEMKKISDIHEESNNIEQFGAGKYNEFKKKLWDLMENPQTSIGAQIIAVVSVVFILISISCLTISTLPQFQPNDTDPVIKNPNPNITATAAFMQYVEEHPLELVEVICIIWFTFEYVSRLFACPNKKTFLKSPMNMIDILAILPYYISVIFTKAFNNPNNPNMESLISARKVVQVFRILRVLRILKLARHSTGLQALGYTLQKSYKELGMLVMFIALGVLLFSSLIYFAEREDNSEQFTSIPATFWWAIITMTTVGYGDMTPKSELGKFIGSFCCICGVLVIALPIPIIVNNFADYYKDQLRREKTLKRKEDMAKARQLGSILSSANYDDEDDDDETGGEMEDRLKEIGEDEVIADQENLELMLLHKNKRSTSLRPLPSSDELNSPGNHRQPSHLNPQHHRPRVTYSETELHPPINYHRQSLSPSHDSIFTLHSTSKNGGSGQACPLTTQSFNLHRNTRATRMPARHKTTSMPLVNTQAYKILQQDIQRKIEKRKSLRKGNKHKLFDVEPPQDGAVSETSVICVGGVSGGDTERETLLETSSNRGGGCINYDVATNNVAFTTSIQNGSSQNITSNEKAGLLTRLITKILPNSNTTTTTTATTSNKDSNTTKYSKYNPTESL